MKRFAFGCAALVAALALSVAVAEELKSGLAVGEAPGAFNVNDVTGPNKGTSLCYRCQYGARPVVAVFARDANDNLAKTIKEIDGLVEKNKAKDMKAFVVVLSEDAEKLAPKLEAMAKKIGIKNVPLTTFDGAAGPEDYKISKDADVTVLMWNKSEVKSNIALAKGKLDAAATQKIIAEAEKLAK
jgi:hypothetical protein